MWAEALGQVFTGNVLEQYSLYVDAFSGNYEGFKNALLQTCGFRTHNNLTLPPAEAPYGALGLKKSYKFNCRS